MFEQRGDVVLDLLELIQTQRGVNDGEDVAGLGLLVNEHAVAVALELLLDLEDAFAFEHHGEDVAGGDVLGVVQLDEFAEERLGVFFLDRVHGRGGRREIDTLPVRDEILLLRRGGAEILLPARLADVGAAQLGVFLDQHRVIRLLVGEGLRA